MIRFTLANMRVWLKSMAELHAWTPEQEETIVVMVAAVSKLAALAGEATGMVQLLNFESEPALILALHELLKQDHIHAIEFFDDAYALRITWQAPEMQPHLNGGSILELA